MRKLMKLTVLCLCLVFASATAWADTIDFECSWDNNKPINISVDTTKKTATRSDGGHNYTVIKASKYAVWLYVDEPDNAAGAAFQVIQRQAFIQPYDSQQEWNNAGKWIDFISSATGTLSPIEGGKCWEATK